MVNNILEELQIGIMYYIVYVLYEKHEHGVYASSAGM